MSMKGKLIRPYSIDMEKTLCAGAEVEIITGVWTADGYKYFCELSGNEQVYIEHDYIDITDYTPYIDWDERRYQIAKTVLPAVVHEYSEINLGIIVNDEALAATATRLADALINELKRK